MNYSWRAQVIQKAMLTLDSDMEPWPKSTITIHLSTDPWNLLFWGPNLSQEELLLPIATIQQP